MFKKLEKRILNKVDDGVSDVRVSIAKIQDSLNIPYGGIFNEYGMFSVFSTQREAPLKDAVQLILDHLGLEIKQVDEVPSKIVLTKKKAKKKVSK